MENKSVPETKLKSMFATVGMVLLVSGLIFILTYIFNWSNVSTESPNFVTIHGVDNNYKIVGRRLILTEGNYFTGIPYGRGIKFKSGKMLPLEHETKAVKWPKECPNAYYQDGNWNECLNLNIYQCTALPNRSLPVLVYVHEGEPNWDSTANLDGNQVINNLACKGMIVVAVHYRQSIFGGMSFSRPSPAVGDIQLALEWVNKSIQNFNGDPLRVTLMGSRKGAQIVSYLSRIPKARELFSQVIMIGGTADDPKVFPENHHFLYKQIHEIAKGVNCSFEGENLENLKKRELNDIIFCIRQFRKNYFFRSDDKLNTLWNRWPIDTSFLDWQTELTPMNTLLGTCRNQPLTTPELIDQVTLEATLKDSKDLKRTYNPDAFVKYYFDRYKNASADISHVMEQARYDFLEVGPLLLEAHTLSAQPNSKVFMFNVDMERSRYEYNSELPQNPAERFAPCLEHLLFRKTPPSDMTVQKFMSDSIANFVIDGNPNKKNGTDLKWSEFSATSTLNTYNVLNINSKGIEVVETWETKAAKFWLCQRDRARNATTSAYCS